MVENNFPWTIKLDWFNILSLLNLGSVDQIPEYKKEKAIKNLDKSFGSDTLLDLEPSELDGLIVSELRDLMKKELSINTKRQERMEKEMRSKIIPFKNRGGGIIKIDPRDFKDMDMKGVPEEFMKYFKKFMRTQGDDDDKDDDNDDDVIDDKTGYYI